MPILNASRVIWGARLVVRALTCTGHNVTFQKALNHVVTDNGSLVRLNCSHCDE